MQKLQKTETTGYPENYETEPQIIQGVQSNSSASNEEKDTSEVAKIQTNWNVHINTERLLEQILSKQNMTEAYRRVKSNKGAAGIDGITLEKFDEYLESNWNRIKDEIAEGRYKPKPVRRVEIPKPDGGKRMLGIPTVIDRVVQQAMLQVLNPVFEQQFSDNSYGFRTGKSAHHAVLKAKEYIEEGYKYVVDIDLAKFFDTVNHDKLMARLARSIKDKRVLKLIRRCLQAGVMVAGVKTKTEVGTPQGGNLSPLLANIVLDELDKELERRGHRFCRYADDCNIYVKSKRAGDRVLKSVTKYIEKQLKLKVNQDKSDTGIVSSRKFLGFTFYWIEGKVNIAIARKVKARIKEKLKMLTKRSQGRSIGYVVSKINEYSRGMTNYFAIANGNSFFKKTEPWLRRRLRMYIWKQWKKSKTKYRNLRKLGLRDLSMKNKQLHLL